MANTLVKQVINNGFRNYVATLSFLADGSGDTSDYDLVDPTSAGDLGVFYLGQTFYPGAYIKIWSIEYQCQGCTFSLEWDATSDQIAFVAADDWGRFDYSKFGGRGVPSGLAGATGKILFNSINAVMAGATVELTIHLHKCFQNT